MQFKQKLAYCALLGIMIILGCGDNDDSPTHEFNGDNPNRSSNNVEDYKLIAYYFDENEFPDILERTVLKYSKLYFESNIYVTFPRLVTSNKIVYKVQFADTFPIHIEWDQRDFPNTKPPPSIFLTGHMNTSDIDKEKPLKIDIFHEITPEGKFELKSLLVYGLK